MAEKKVCAPKKLSENRTAREWTREIWDSFRVAVASFIASVVGFWTLVYGAIEVAVVLGFEWAVGIASVAWDTALNDPLSFAALYAIGRLVMEACLEMWQLLLSGEFFNWLTISVALALVVAVLRFKANLRRMYAEYKERLRAHA